MPLSEKKKKSNEKYIKSTFDEIKTRVPKGKKEIIQKCASEQGQSLNAFINEAIDEKIEREESPSA